MMTDLSSPAARRTSPAGGGLSGRPMALTAIVGGAFSACCMLILTTAVALAGWFAADAGRYGDTRDAMRVGADAWLVAHGAALHLDTATISVLPLGLTALCAYVAYRVGVWAAATSTEGQTSPGLGPVLTATGVQATVYGLVAMAAAVLAAHPLAETHLLRALLGGVALSGVAGGAGLLAGSGEGRALWRRASAWTRMVLAGSAATVLLLIVAGSFLVGGALVMDFGTAATVLSRLHTDVPGGLVYTIAGSLFVPNAALLAVAYLLGPGFAVGTATVVSPTAVSLGPVPAFPLLAALPSDGATPAWTTALMGVPILLTIGAVMLAARVGEVERIEASALAGLGAGLVAALVLTGLVVLAGGSAGPGRMAEVGAAAGSILAAAAVSLGAGGLVGGVLASWRAHRRSRAVTSTRGPSRAESHRAG